MAGVIAMYGKPADARFGSGGVDVYVAVSEAI